MPNQSQINDPRFWVRWRAAGAVVRIPPPVVDPRYRVNYAGMETPPNYQCHKCGAAGCKLWREYQTFLNHQTLLCAKCAAASQNKSIADIDTEGNRSGEHGVKTDQIGWYVPAIPTEENDTYWGYTTVPQAGIEWWRRLPSLPVIADAA